MAHLSLNTVTIAGTLTRDPQVRFLANEKAVAEFGLAINKKYRGSDGEMKEEVTFIDVTCWGKIAENVGQYLTKGRNCLCEGELKLDQWDDKESGKKRSKISVTAHRVHFLGDAQKGEQRPQSQGQDAVDRGTANTATSDQDEDLSPF